MMAACTCLSALIKHVLSGKSVRVISSMLEVQLIRYKRGYGVFDAKASVDGKAVTTAAELMCVFKEVETI